MFRSDYLQSLGLQRDAFVQAMGLSFSVSTLALAVGLAGNASLPGAMLGWSVLMLAPALLGMALGGWLRRRLSPLWFRRCLMAGLLALGGHMVLAG
ncbi:TSUP family transporter [Alicycliphilus denitrificans]|uniref:TSUP family transporter n=1 Tax=Alicycliphilus denitrificans TaxID=179636 RepID=UPI0002F010A7|nr:TSUP family transporter [Alicycliphilus denitrificans]